MKFYDALKHLYLETDASSIDLEAGLLQVRKDMNCGHNDVSDNLTLCLITFASKGISSAEQWYSSTEREV